VPEDEYFPIEDYDELTAAEILSVLSLLDLEELEQVRDHEQEGAARTTVLRRIDQRIDSLERKG
jgi:hypothetical protein